MIRDKQISFLLERGIGIILLIFLSANSNSQTVNPEWITDTMLLEDMEMAYHLYIPQDYDESLSYPLVVHLHGADLSIQEKLELLPTFRGPVDFVSESVQSKYPCIVLAPISISEPYTWIEFSEPSDGRDYSLLSDQNTFHPLLELIDSIASSYNIDSSRIYLNGISAGGVGAWSYLGEYPDYFAAALILCGFAWTNTESQMNSIVHIPIWNHHGDRDNIQPVEYSRIIFQNYETRGIPVFYPDQQKYVKPNISDSLKINITEHEIDYIYSEHKGKGHNVWDVCFNDTLVYKWLFSKRKRTKGIISFQGDSTESDLQAEHLFKIDCEVDSLKIVLQYSADLGYSWITVAEHPSSEASILLNTQELDDSPQGQFRILLVSSNDAYIIGSDYSAYFKVDNEKNFSPWLKHYLSAVKYGTREIAQFVEQLKVMLYANDVENDSLDLEFYIRINEDSEYKFLERRKIKAMNSDQEYFINVDTLDVNSPTRIKFVLSDGDNTVSDSTDIFYSLDYEKTNIGVWPAEINMDINDSVYLFSYIYPVYEADRVVYLYSKNPEIATIDGNVVHAVSPGQTYICLVVEADDGHFEELCRVTVKTPASSPAAKTDLVRIYPNPTNDILRIHAGSRAPVIIEVISINGQLLYTATYHGSSQTLDLSSFQSGIYFISVWSDNFVTTRKIIKL